MPVLADLYERSKLNGKQPVQRLISPTDLNPLAFFDGSDAVNPHMGEFTSVDEVIDRVWKKYGKLSAFKLSDLIHKPNTSWFNAFHQRGRRSTNEDAEIQFQYSRLADAA